MTGPDKGNENVERRLHSSKYELSTPALLLDLDVFEANLAKMSQHARDASINLRPHGKSHKCPDIAKRLVEAGALGVCATTIREAESFVHSGVTGVLITSEMIGPDRVERLLALARLSPELMCVVDSPQHAANLDHAARSQDIRLNVLIDVDLGIRRTGVATVDDGMRLAELISILPGLHLGGIHAYSSVSAHIVGYEARRAHSFKSMEPALELLSRLRHIGMPCEILTGGSTGTYNIDTGLEAMTELQPGSYVFMDVDYQNIGGKSGPVLDDFGVSLTVLASVVSRNHAGFATIDAGFKAFATDRPFGPEAMHVTGIKYHFGGDEHGILELKDTGHDIRLGDKLEFIVPHCDPTVNLYDRLYCVRGDRIEDVWAICRGYD
jgi:D-serine deaminase-like pyridoxal phosphate-dependent protein